MQVPDDLSDVVFYTTETFNLGHQIRATQSTDGFLGDALGGNEAVEDPLWSGTHTAGSQGRVTTPTGSERLKRSVSDGEQFTTHKRNDRRRKRNAARRNLQGLELPSAIALPILEHVKIFHDNSVDTKDFPHAASAFAGKNDRSDVRRYLAQGASSTQSSTVSLDTITVQEFLSQLDLNCPVMVRHLIKDRGYRYIVNDISVAQAFTDTHKRIYAVKVRQPRRDWPRIYGKAEHAFEVLSEHYSLEPHRRGLFKTCNCGLTMGMGSTEPHILDKSDIEIHAEFIHEVEQYVRHFTVSARLWMPELMEEYTDLQVELFAINSALRAIFPDSPFCAFTMNMGPHTVCLGHRDFWNLAYGTCPIGALGPFNHRTGGHIILHEPKLIIEFRRGDVIFIPSAAVTHENVPIASGETRYSFAMYTAGGLFRYAWCGMRTVKEIQENDKGLYARYVAEGPGRWEDGWKKYSTIGDLISRAQDGVQ